MKLTPAEWRRLKNVTKAEMARRLEIHVQTLDYWEEHPSKMSFENAEKYCKAIDIAFDDVSFMP